MQKLCFYLARLVKSTSEVVRSSSEFHHSGSGALLTIILVLQKQRNEHITSYLRMFLISTESAGFVFVPKALVCNCLAASDCKQTLEETHVWMVHEGVLMGHKLFSDCKFTDVWFVL